MRKYVLFVLLFVVLFVNVSDVYAAKSKKKFHKCDSHPTLAQPILASYIYPIPDGGDPSQDWIYVYARYQDYMEDMLWWASETNVCPSKFHVEPYPQEYYPPE